MNKEEILKSAKLGKIEIKNNELEIIKSEISDTFNYLKEIENIKIPESKIGKEKEILFGDLREDVVKDFEKVNLLQNNFPKVKNGFVKIPVVIKK